MNIIIHTKDGCPWCDMAKNWLTQNGFSFKTILHNDDQDRQEFYESCGENIKSVPQIFWGDERIGGYTDLMKRKDELLVSRTEFDEDF